MNPFGRSALLRAGMAAALTITVAACGGSGSDRDAGGTVALSGGAVAQADEAIDLRASSSGPIHDVAMVGDSITVASAPALEQMASGLGIDLTIRAEVGRRISSGDTPAPGTSIVEEILAEDKPDLWVIALGTNDLGQYSTDAEYIEQINGLLALIPDDAPVAWINTYITEQPDAAEQFDAALVTALGARGDATIGEWAPFAEQDGTLSDGIHPTDDGTLLFANVVQGQIASWLDQPA